MKADQLALPAGHTLSSLNAADQARLKLLLSIATALATYQLYFLPLAGTYFPLSLFAILACLPFVRVSGQDKAFAFLTVVYITCVVLSLAWSPDKGAWANGVVYGFLFFFGYFAARSLKAEADLARVLKVFLAFASLNAVLVILFRVLPGIEEAFWDFGLINLFKNPKRVANLAVFRPNVFDPLKAGGVFDNANTGAAFNLICLGVALSLLPTLRKRVVVPAAMLFAIAIAASGSKSAILILAGLGVLCGYLLLATMRNALLRLTLVFLVLSAGVAAVWALMSLGSLFLDSSFGQETLHTSTYRALLLQVAQKAFLEQPFTGLGFGGWSKYLQNYAFLYGLEDYWPPHNGIVLAWVESGLMGVVALLACLGILFSRLLAAAFASASRAPAIGALFALAATVLMSLGDTFQLIGSQNAAVPLGVLMAWGVSAHATKRIEADGHD